MPCASRTASSNAGGSPSARAWRSAWRAQTTMSPSRRGGACGPAPSGASAAAVGDPPAVGLVAGRVARLLPRVLEREREHVGDLVLAAVLAVESADASLADKGHRQLGVADLLGLEHARHEQRDRLAVEVHARGVEHLDEVHESSCSRRDRAAGRFALAASTRSP